MPGVVNDQLGQAPTTLCTLGLSISDPDLHSETLSTMTSGEEKEAHSRGRQQASTVVYGCFFLPSLPCLLFSGLNYTMKSLADLWVRGVLSVPQSVSGCLPLHWAMHQ